MSSYKFSLSIITTFYNNANCVDKFFNEIEKIYKKFKDKNYQNEIELIIVNDGSKKSEYDILINRINNKEFKIKLISHLSNQGQHQSLISGLKHSKKNYVAIINFDLDEDPKHILELYEKIIDDKDIQSIVCVTDYNYNNFKNILSSLFWKLYNFSYKDRKLNLKKRPRTLRVMTRVIVDNIISNSKRNIFFEGLFRESVDLNLIKYLEIKVNKSDTSYSFIKRLKLSLVAFYNKKHFVFNIYLALLIFIGFLSLLVSFKYLLQYLFLETSVPGFPSIIISLWFLGSVITAGISLILYILLDMRTEKEFNKPIEIKIDEN